MNCKFFDLVLFGGFLDLSGGYLDRNLLQEFEQIIDHCIELFHINAHSNLMQQEPYSKASLFGDHSSHKIAVFIASHLGNTLHSIVLEANQKEVATNLVDAKQHHENVPEEDECKDNLVNDVLGQHT